MVQLQRQAAYAVVLAAGLVATLVAADPLAQLGVNPREANEQLMSAVTAGNPPFGVGVTAFKKLSPTVRATVVTDLFSWARTTTSSSTFKAAYTAYRTRQKPEAPEFEGTVDQELQKSQAKQAADLAESRKMLASLPANQRKELEDGLRQAEAMFKSPEMVSMVRQGIAADRQSKQERFTQDTKEWEERYPVTPQPLIAKGLRRLLDATGDVDFNAKLVSRGGRMAFVDPALEEKSSDWKMAYRAGREAVSAARLAATAWLKELGM